MQTTSRDRARLKVRLELMTLVGPNAAAVFFAGWFVVGWEPVRAALWSLLTAIVLAGYWQWHRQRFPARVTEPAEPEAVARPRREMEEGAGPIWNPSNLLVLVIGAVVVTVVVVVGLLLSILLPLAVIVLFGAAAGGDMGGVVSAAVATLAVALVIEFALVLPLAKRWRLAVDDGPRRTDYCPPGKSSS